MSDRTRLATCEGKQTFANGSLAWAVQKRRTWRGHKRSRAYRTNEPYLCPYCHRWHIGARPGRIDRGRE